MAETKQQIVAGVDGCPGGWVVVTMPLGRPGEAAMQLCRTFQDIVDIGAAMTAIDMPIGLLDRVGPGGRSADVAARKVLGSRRSSIFSVPSRSAVMATDYRNACSLAHATSDPPRKVSQQSFHIFPKIREVDALMTPDLQKRVVECHPEVVFWALNGETPLAERKKHKSRPHPPGLTERREILARLGFTSVFLHSRPEGRRRDVGDDDILDACACAASAQRILTKTARRFPPEPLIDPKGLRIEIWG